MIIAVVAFYPFRLWRHDNKKFNLILQNRVECPRWRVGYYARIQKISDLGIERQEYF